MTKSFAPSYYIGIGFSVDHIQALQVLLQNLDCDIGACFILASGMSLAFTSSKIEQLRQHTRMPIRKAEDGMFVEANSIYWVPLHKTAIVASDCISLSDATSDIDLNLPIDTFFCALAKRHQRKAIGILLEGTGADGNGGLKVLRTLGGSVIVEQPSLGEYSDTNPMGVDISGVNIMLPPDKIGQYLSRSLYRPLLSESYDQRVLPSRPEQVNERIQYLEQQLKRSREYLQIALGDMATAEKDLWLVKQKLHQTTVENQKQISEVVQVKRDLDHVLRFIDFGVIFLDSNLLIRCFTSTATEYMDLSEADIMCSIFHVSLSFTYEKFMDDINQAIKTKLPVQKDITEQDRQWTMAIVPYVLPEQEVIAGVTIIFKDESQSNFFESALNVTYRELHNSIRNALDLLDTQPFRQKLDVLLVDDNDADILLVQKQFMRCTDCAYEMHLAQTGEEALQIVKFKKVDICVVDYRLKNETAIEVTHLLRESGYDIPVIVITGYPEDTLYAELLSHNILDMIYKDDITPQLISRSIRYAIRRHEIDSSIDKVLNSPIMELDSAVH